LPVPPSVGTVDEPNTQRIPPSLLPVVSRCITIHFRFLLVQCVEGEVYVSPFFFYSPGVSAALEMGKGLADVAGKDRTSKPVPG